LLNSLYGLVDGLIGGMGDGVGDGLVDRVGNHLGILSEGKAEYEAGYKAENKVGSIGRSEAGTKTRIESPYKPGGMVGKLSIFNDQLRIGQH